MSTESSQSPLVKQERFLNDGVSIGVGSKEYKLSDRAIKCVMN